MTPIIFTISIIITSIIFLITIVIIFFTFNMIIKTDIINIFVPITITFIYTISKFIIITVNKSTPPPFSSSFSYIASTKLSSSSLSKSKLLTPSSALCLKHHLHLHHHQFLIIAINIFRISIIMTIKKHHLHYLYHLQHHCDLFLPWSL